MSDTYRSPVSLPMPHKCKANCKQHKAGGWVEPVSLVGGGRQDQLMSFQEGMSIGSFFGAP